MRKFTFSLLIVMCLLCGCTVVADRIYTVCKIDGDTVYVYSNGDLYTYVDGDLVPCYDPNIVKEPALQLITTDNAYNFAYVLPGLYKGTLEDVSAYVKYLEEKDDAKCMLIHSDCDNMELLITSDSYLGRIYFNIRGDVRMYFKDKSNLSIEPVYLLES